MNKKILLILVVLLALPVVNASTTAVYTGFNFSVKDNADEGVDLTFDGTNFYIVEYFNDKILEYNSTGSYTGFNFSIRDQNGGDVIPVGIDFNGTYFYIVEVVTDKVYEYNSTGSYTGFNFSVAEQGTSFKSIYFNGTSFYIVSSDDNVWEYNSTGNNTGFNFSISVAASSFGGLTKYNDYFYFTTRDIVLQYNSTGNYTGWNFSIVKYETQATGIDFNGTSFFVLGTDSDRVSEYLLVGDVGICNSTFTYPIANFTIYDENIPATKLNASSVDIEIFYWYYNISDKSNFTAKIENANNFGICSEINTSVNTDTYVLYKANFTHRYIVLNKTLSNLNIGQNYLYNFNTTITDLSTLKITTRYQDNYIYYPNVIGKLQRKYYDEGVWRTVQMDMSDDFGLLIYNIYETTTDYRLIFLDENNNILKTTERMKFYCTSSLCDLTVLLDPFSAVSPSTTTNVTAAFDNITNTINISWNNIAGDSVSIDYLIRRDTMTGSVYVCNGTLTAASGNIDCNVTGYTGEVYVRVKAGDDYKVSEYIKLDTEKLGDLVGNLEGGLWTVGVILTIVMIGVFSPAGAIIAMVVGLLSMFLFGMFTPLTVTFVIIVGGLGILIATKVRT